MITNSNTCVSDSSCVIKCENPNIILHPYAKSYFIKHGCFVFDGEIVNDFSLFSRHRRIKEYDFFYKHYVCSFFSKYKVHPDHYFDYDSLFLNYHFISNDGEIFPMFMIVPCGKCNVCTYTKLTEISNRCELETFTSRCNPLFVTLTYDNEHLPDGSNVSISDIQKFLKLLRINLNRFFATPYVDENGKTRYKDAKISLRYIYSSEYTPSSQRPHYHLLIWNVPYFPNGLSEYQKKFFESRLDGYPDGFSSNVFNSIRSVRSSCAIGCSYSCDLGRVYGYDTLKKLVWCSWKKGFIKCEVSRDAGRYVAKYIGKGSKVPEGRCNTFVRWSTCRGLGFGAFDLYFKDLLLKNPSLTSISFCDPKNGHQRTVAVPKYYRNLLSPCLSVVARPFREDLTLFHKLFVFSKRLFRSHYGSDWFELSEMHKNVYKKFELFDDLCGLSVPLIPDGFPDISTLNYDLKTSLDEYECFNYLSDFLHELYDTLMAFDLDSIHLQDILNYKYVSQFARIDYAQKHPRPLEHFSTKATDYYDRVSRLEYSHDIL